MKKRVSSSHLALRFYKASGWTKEILEKYLIRGTIEDTAVVHGDREEWAYFRMTVGSQMNMEALLENEISEVGRWYDGPSRESDLDYLKSMNW